MSRVWWEWYCSLFPVDKKREIDPYTWRCKCGHTWKFSKFKLLLMFLFEDYVYTCPQCHRQSRYRMITHVVRETDTDKIRRNNRWID